jgi:hypothetical protein
MWVRWLVAVCAFAVLGGTPLASARTQVFGDPVGPIEATGPGGANVPFDDGGFTCDPASGSLFQIGVTTVTCDSGAPFDVTVVDTKAPALSGMPADQSVSTDSPPETVTWSGPSATDLVDGSVATSCLPSSGSSFNPGLTTVTCSATDAHNNSSSGSFTVTVTVTDTTDPVITVPTNITSSTTDPSGKVITYNATAIDNIDGPVAVSCDPPSGTNFPANGSPTTVTCSASDAHGNSATASFTVTINYIDNIPPVISGMPGNISTTTTVNAPKTVSWASPTATDNVDGTLTVTCTPASGSSFPISPSPTTVDCTATDAHGNTGEETFTVTVTLVDVTAPVLTNHANITTTTEVNAPKQVTYANPTATDNIDGTLPVSCTPASGSNFPQNGSPTTVSCTATDAHGNIGHETFTITVNLIDVTKPVLSGVPGNIAQNTEVPSGKVINYSLPTASDNLDGPLPVTCTKASGTNFVVGTTPVTCSATDAHNNTGSATFNVVITLIDITKPVLSDVPDDITTEANGPTGSKVNFVPPTAVDNLDGPIANVPCAPLSGSTFPLGTTSVTCSATDAHGNTGTATFKINVVDTTPPTLIPPGNTTVYATSDTGAAAADQGPITRFIFGSHIADIADANPKVTADNPQFFPVGTTTVVFTATDASGNKKSAAAKLTVLPKPAPGTTPPALPPPTENTPPANVTGLTGKGGDRRATLKWTNPKASDFAAVEIERGTSAAFSSVKATGTVVYHGTGTSYVDKGLTNDVSYRYVVHSLDKNGNKSEGVGINITPHFQPLRTPADGARLAAIPKKFVWTRDPKASYYNFQLFLGGTLLFQSTTAEPRKILSTWTTGPSLNFKSPWKWEGRSYRLAKGTYTWYVWPGYGARADVKYGPFMGPATFQITKTPKPAKPKKKKK